MSHTIIDRRQNDKGKSTPNRSRYVRRVKQEVREAVKKTIEEGSIKDIVTDKGKKVRIPGKGLKKPEFQHDVQGGVKDGVLPGNKKFAQGDRIDRPEGGGAGGGGPGSASPDGEGEDGFEFHLTQQEFLDLFFEDLELPDLVKKSMAKVDEWVNRRAGFSVDGNPSQLNIVRSMKQAKGRRHGLRAPKKKKLKKLEAELEALESLDNLSAEQNARVVVIKKEIEVLKRRIKAVPFIDDMDLRYNRWDRVPIPSTQAVMFCIMDVSGSMGSWEKEMAKRFFMVLYLFLSRNYERVEVVFVRHHTTAKEVDEEEFFYSRESGGTLVSSAIQLTSEIIKDRFNPEQWNIFCCQASDGDNWADDSVRVQEIMSRHVLKVCQYYAYVEIDQRGSDSDLWPYYEALQKTHPNMAMAVIKDQKEIFPVFRGLFEKRKVK